MILKWIPFSLEKSKKSWPGGPGPKEILPKKQGFNRFHWDLRRESLPSVEKVFVYGSYSGSRVSPGNYKAKLKVNEKEKVVEINVLPNPNLSISQSDFDKQQELLVKIENSIRDVHESVTNMREVQKQLKHYQQYGIIEAAPRSRGAEYCRWPWNSMQAL